MNKAASQVAPPEATQPAGKKTKRRLARPTAHTKTRPPTEEEIERKLYEAGVIENLLPPRSQRPPRRPFKPIVLRGGGPTASELIIAERR
jgi:hypothetical protein